MTETIKAFTNRGYIERVYSEKPKRSFVYCGVAGCPKMWECEGGKQGFIKSSAASHSMAHWYRFHEEQKHHGTPYPSSCLKCKKVFHQEFRRRVAK